jgi:hypothetical protein
MYGLQSKGWELNDVSRTRRGAARVLTETEEEQEVIRAIRSQTVVSASDRNTKPVSLLQLDWQVCSTFAQFQLGEAAVCRVWHISQSLGAGLEVKG